MDNSKWALKYDTAAQDFLGADERVLAAVQVARGGGWTALGLSQISGLGAIAAMIRGKKRAGGLPQQFLLAVTETSVVALALPTMSSGLKPRAVKELRRWDRAAVEVSSRKLPINCEIVVAERGSDERIECQGPAGELTDRVVRAAAGGRVAEAVAA